MAVFLADSVTFLIPIPVVGLWVDGRWVDGFWVDGRWVDSLWVDGRWVDSLWVDDRWVNSLWVDGLGVDGFWVDGRWVDGFPIVGFFVGGLSLAGCSGNAFFVVVFFVVDDEYFVGLFWDLYSHAVPSSFIAKPSLHLQKELSCIVLHVP